MASCVPFLRLVASSLERNMILFSHVCCLWCGVLFSLLHAAVLVLVGVEVMFALCGDCKDSMRLLVDTATYT